MLGFQLVGRFAIAFFRGYSWDHTCIHGFTSNGFGGGITTAFPHAINQAASFDVDLVARIASTVALETRASNANSLNRTQGQALNGVNCDGGPLANNAHDPHWGRISETYGEDPHLISRIGVSALRALQNRTDGYLMTSQTTRHFIGYHQTNAMPKPDVVISDRDLYDQFLPAYEAYQTEGEANGIMCGYAAFDKVPSCANTRLLQTILREQWNSDAMVQSDCCNSVNSIWSLHGYVASLEDAVAAAMNAGTQLCYMCHLQEQDAVLAAIAHGKINESTLDAAVSRMLLTRFKHGEFDQSHPWSWITGDEIDTPQARVLAREAAGKSAVLAVNKDRLLPLSKLPDAVAVIGPFGDCGQCYMHSYSPAGAYVNSYLNATRAHAPNAAFSDGSNLANATATAAQADLVLLCLGLGQLESEGTDRAYLGYPPEQLALWKAVRSAAKPGAKLVLVSASGGVRRRRHDFETISRAFVRLC